MEWTISGWSKGGLPGSSAERAEGVVVDVVDHSGIGSSLRIYRREEGEETVYTEQIDSWQAISSARRVLTRHYTIPAKGEVNRECFPGSGPVSDKWPEGKYSNFSILEACDRWTDRIFGFVGFFWATFMYKTFSSELRIILYDFSKF